MSRGAQAMFVDCDFFVRRPTEFRTYCSLKLVGFKNRLTSSCNRNWYYSYDRENEVEA